MQKYLPSVRPMHYYYYCPRTSRRAVCVACCSQRVRRSVFTTVQIPRVVRYSPLMPGYGSSTICDAVRHRPEAQGQAEGLCVCVCVCVCVFESVYMWEGGGVCRTRQSKPSLERRPKPLRNYVTQVAHVKHSQAVGNRKSVWI